MGTHVETCMGSHMGPNIDSYIKYQSRDGTGNAEGFHIGSYTQIILKGNLWSILSIMGSKNWYIQLSLLKY